MTTFYIYHRKHSKTGIRLGATLGWASGSGGSTMPESGSIVLRWGNVTDFPHGKTSSCVFNKPECIKLAADKPQALRQLNAAGVPSLAVYPDDRLIQYPALGRPARHERGEGMFPCNNASDVRNARDQGADYFVRLLNPGFKEYRVHCFFGKAIRTTWKKSPTEEIGQLTPDAGMVAIALKAVAALGLDFGAVDIVKETSGAYTVLEVNTAPEIDGSDFPAWLKALRELEAFMNARKIAADGRTSYPGWRGL